MGQTTPHTPDQSFLPGTILRSASTLLTHDADPCRTTSDHVEFARRGAAHINDAPATVWPSVDDANHDGPAVAHVRNKDLRPKGQGAMSRS